MPTQLKVTLVGVTKQLKNFFRGFRGNVLPQLEVPTSMTLRCLPLPWTNVVLTAVVNKLISMLFLKRVSWVCVSLREARPGMRSLLKLSSRICRRDLLFLSITVAAIFSFHAVAIMLFLLLSSFVMMKSERKGLLLSLSSIIAWRNSRRSVFILFLVIMLYRSDSCSFLSLLLIAQGVSRANPVKDLVMLRTSVEFSHNNISKFSWVGYDTHVYLRARDQIHNPSFVALNFHRW